MRIHTMLTTAWNGTGIQPKAGESLMAWRAQQARWTAAAVTLAVVLAAPSFSATGARTQAPSESPSEGEVRALVARAIAAQHNNDAALAEYERRERRQVFKGERVAEDKTHRVVPTGTGTLRLLMEENGRGVTPEFYRKQLRDLEQALVWALDPNEAKQRQRVEKWQRRSRERRELVDAVGQAFRFTWQGRETRNGASLAKLSFQPDPAFQPKARNSDLFRHVRGTMWIEESEGHLARIEAEIATDIAVFAGVFGKIYKGGRFVLEQAPMADGVWLPSRIEYDFAGRRFLFGFEMHESTTAAAYHRIGPPREALAAIRQELSNGAALSPAK
jgi:hypothetical protein